MGNKSGKEAEEGRNVGKGRATSSKTKVKSKDTSSKDTRSSSTAISTQTVDSKASTETGAASSTSQRKGTGYLRDRKRGTGAPGPPSSQKVLIFSEEQETPKTSPSVPSETYYGRKSVKQNSLIVAAIDFGTTFSGYAYCTRSGFTNPGGPKINIPTWAAGASMSTKAPTCVLFDKDKKFKQFGYDANTEFQEDEDANNGYFFKHFKMKLFEEKDSLTRDTMLLSENGKKMPAIDVFAAVIENFKTNLLKSLISKDTDSPFSESDIHWVLTVPAIWNLKAKQFMREAADKAGIEDYQLTLALEPEAASLYCRKVPNSVDRNDCEGPSIAGFKAGEKYLILDLGGGTIDITAHEVMEDDHLKEINEPTGGYWGGLRVNEEFHRFLQRLCGQDVLHELKSKYPVDWQELIDEFERKKCAYDPRGHLSNVTIHIPLVLSEEYKEATECELKDTIDQSAFNCQVVMKKDKLRIDKSIFEKFFENSTTNVLKTVEDLLRTNDKLSDMKTILVVGGYAESPIMQKAIKDRFEGRYRIIIPINPGLAILQGAVMYGFELDAVKSRVCKYTYGIAHQRKFIEGFDDPNKRKTYGRHNYVDDAFDIHVGKGDLVKYGEFQTGKDYHPVNDQQTTAWFDFYASSEKNPQFVTEDSCACLGFVQVELSERQKGADATVTLQINISGTDIEVKAIEKRTGNTTKALCNFLG